MNALNTEFLDNATAEALHTHLCDPAVDLGEGRSTLEWLLLNRPEVAHEVLCHFYDIACYRVGEVYTDRTDIPLADMNKWFVSTAAESHLPDVSIPLALTEAAARSEAVVYLKLDKLFLGNDLPFSAEFNYQGTVTGRISSKDNCVSERPKSAPPAAAVY